MIQQIIRLFDDPSCLPHLCTPTARLPALTSARRSRISLRERKNCGEERLFIIYKDYLLSSVFISQNVSYFTPDLTEKSSLWHIWRLTQQHKQTWGCARINQFSSKHSKTTLEQWYRSQNTCFTLSQTKTESENFKMQAHSIGKIYFCHFKTGNISYIFYNSLILS